MKKFIITLFIFQYYNTHGSSKPAFTNIPPSNNTNSINIKNRQNNPENTISGLVATLDSLESQLQQFSPPDSVTQALMAQYQQQATILATRLSSVNPSEANTVSLFAQQVSMLAQEVQDLIGGQFAQNDSSSQNNVLMSSFLSNLTAEIQYLVGVVIKSYMLFSQYGFSVQNFFGLGPIIINTSTNSFVLLNPKGYFQMQGDSRVRAFINSGGSYGQPHYYYLDPTTSLVPTSNDISLSLQNVLIIIARMQKLLYDVTNFANSLSSQENSTGANINSSGMSSANYQLFVNFQQSFVKLSVTGNQMVNAILSNQQQSQSMMMPGGLTGPLQAYSGNVSQTSLSASPIGGNDSFVVATLTD